MKRKEMIELIYQELIFSRKPMHGIRITDSPADRNLAEQILNVQEEAGMLPPEIINWEESSAIELHEWEKEDET